ncbi:hypothetical protein CFP56_002924 [Quercus suber]|uniref:Uncharacterized protein n=1 Tax=Quercus suber TaxID=58331 RepID=A0AAW0IKA5_QUESU
MWKRIQRLQKN